MMSTTATLSLLKENEQDFEWYPTTDAIIDAVFNSWADFKSLLDIGAGDGRVLERIDKLNFNRRNNSERNHTHTEFQSTIKKYAIEKSIIHIEKMPPDISIVGTDFTLQTLIDKKVDVIFCNPPYSEYEEWATKTIKEANAKAVFLVLPARWTDSKLIKRAIEQRHATNRVIWSGDFMNADRKARARVDVVKILITDADNEWERKEHDPFDVWFDDYFSGFEAIRAIDDDEAEENKPNPLREIVKGRSLIDHLCKLYINEMKSLLSNYKSLSQLDAVLLKELGIETKQVKDALKLKIQNVKNKYWKELFDNLDKVNSRLTSSSRQSMLEKLNESCNVDFSVENAYAVVLWVIKNANKYIDRQLVEVFKELSEPECVKNYVSNLRTWEKDGWRYKKNHTKYMLEYRIITHRYSAIKSKDSYYNYDFHNGLSKDCHSFINDIFTIANNLGFINRENSEYESWESNHQITFRTNNNKTLVAIRAFKNGNLHLKFDQAFIKTLNVEASRLLKWIKSPQEAVDEMGMDFNFVKSIYKTNLLFGASEHKKLLAG